MDVLNEEMDAIFKSLSEDEASQLNILLDKIRTVETIAEHKPAETPITG
jgi:hypothetical protein